MLWVIDLYDTPWVNPSTNGLTVNFDFLLGADDGERKKSLYDDGRTSRVVTWRTTLTYTEFLVVLDCLLVIFFNIIWEIVDWDIVELDVLHDLRRNQKTC